LFKIEGKGHCLLLAIAVSLSQLQTHYHFGDNVEIPDLQISNEGVFFTGNVQNWRVKVATVIQSVIGEAFVRKGSDGAYPIDLQMYNAVSEEVNRRAGNLQSTIQSHTFIMQELRNLLSSSQRRDHELSAVAENRRNLELIDSYVAIRNALKGWNHYFCVQS